MALASFPELAPPTGIIVIGGGIIGVTAALALQSEGHQVRLIERTGIAAETSSGNAGAFAYADIEPLATPGIMRKAPKWLLDPLGPLSLRPGYALRMTPWMLKFWRASRKDRYAAAVQAQSAMMQFSAQAQEALITRLKAQDLIRRQGQLQLYEGRAAFAASQPGWALRRRHGVVCEMLESPGAIAEIQPGVSPRFTHAGFTPEWMNTVDPALWTRHVARAFTEAGGQIETAEVRALKPLSPGVEVQTATGTLRAAKVVLAAGAWSKRLAATLGDRLPLDTERGYNTTFPTAAFDLRTHLTFSDHGFVVTRIGAGLRVGGAVELGGMELPPNYRRAEILLDKARSFLEGFDPRGGKQWMGYRPSMPDSLPVIDQAPGSRDVIYAFGHGHLGLTQSAGTAQLVAALCAGRRPGIDLSPFRATRF
ncbi:FAD-dependent oxidoreductase [Pseudooceanicola sp. CBS1P-1]|uniref:FAD-dependent oxidoreductase n=1 Tax=Pseudooceanicola albus TaxID=2692189 RepID=A0A6L7G5X0_9RHOB|nr:MULTISPECIES: FAD-dependent oxidoreductase [Pseudooceanicola]MBT9386064.1 FAD-dependent oxidoreductase [Pseudooceanicola endophyticus]MXN19515.1 FAD-dependent oxidoreductase [Pseudooceanicola albus]